jgi:probable phosphoglycerate mutase
VLIDGDGSEAGLRTGLNPMESMVRLYLMRHGLIDWPETDCFIGQTDAPLSAQGRLQADEWRRTLSQVKISAVWSSDLVRASETARIIFADRAVDVETVPDLREIQLGEWDGVSRAHVKESHPDLWRARGDDLAGYRPPGGESFHDLQERVVRRTTQIVTETTGSVCLVTHAGVIRVLICHFLQMPLTRLFRIRVDYAGLSIVLCSSERIELCALNLKASAPGCAPGLNIGGPHDPA